jgi:hypothetical protein
MTGAIRPYSRAAIAQKDLQENMTIHIQGPISGRISVARLAGVAALAAGLATMPAITFSQTCPAPGAQPTATTTTVQDRDQMLCQLHVTLPTLPPRAQDPHAPPGSFPLDPTQPDGNWTDNTVPVGIELVGDSGPITPAVGGDTVQRSDFGLWNGYIDQAGIGPPRSAASIPVTNRSICCARTTAGGFTRRESGGYCAGLRFFTRLRLNFTEFVWMPNFLR